MRFAVLKDQFQRWFHPRKLLIVSDHRVRQMHIGVGAQLCVVLLLASGLIWSSYATGRFITTRATLQEQNVALRSITNTKVDSMFSNIMPRSVLPRDGGSPLRFSGMGNDPMLARVAMLEQRVTDLKNANELIIERVRAKTSGHIDNLESIIRQTGLDPDTLKKQAEKALRSKHENAEGGPFIPARLAALSEGAGDMFDSLDKLDVLRKIVGNLPLAMPIDNPEEQSPFGHRVDPFSRHLAFHSGIDLAAPAYSEVRSTADGIVVSAGREGAYGNMVDIDHGFGVVTRYGHLSDITVAEGEEVHKGDQIGVQGSTGRSTGPHLHYEVRYHDQPINPKKFLEAGRAVSQN